MSADVTQFQPGYGGLYDSTGNLKNLMDLIDPTYGLAVDIKRGGGGGGGGGGGVISNDITTATMQNAATADGNGTTLNTANMAFAVIDIQGTFSATINFEATIDGTNYFALPVVNIQSSVISTTATSSGQFAFRCAAYPTVRARISGYSTGSITIYGRASANGQGHHAVSVVNSPSVTVSNASIPVTDNGGSLTVDGTVAVSNSTFPVTDNGGSLTVDSTQLPAALTGSGNLKVSLSESNATVNVLDNGGSLTVDSAQLPAALTGSGNLKVSLSESNATVNVLDNGGSLTVDSTQLPTSLTGSGNLKVAIQEGGLTGSTSNASDGVATSSTNLPTVAYNYGYNGTTWDALRVDSNKNLVVSQRSNSFTVVALNAVAATGSSSSYDSTGFNKVTIRLTGTYVGQVQLEASHDNSTFSGVSVSTGGSSAYKDLASPMTSAGQYMYFIPAPVYIRVRVSSYTSGNITATLIFTNEPQFLNYGNTTATNYGISVTPLDNSGNKFFSNNITGNSATFSATSTFTSYFAHTTGYNGSAFTQIRVGTIYKYIEYLALANATATTVWTPAASKKFRLMGVQVSSSAAATLHLRDGTAGSGTKFHSYRTGGADTKDFSFGQGYISSAANNVLEIYNATGSAVDVWITAWGTEE